MKKSTILALCSVFLLANSDFEAYKQDTYKKFNAYYEKEMKAFKAFSQNADGIEDIVNPYQEIEIVPPAPSPKKVVEKPKEPEVVTHKPNSVPENSPSGSQVDSVKPEKIKKEQLVAPDQVVAKPSVSNEKQFVLSFFGEEIEFQKRSLDFVKTLDKKADNAKLAEEIRRSNDQLISEIKRVQKAYYLNDWDTFVLIQTLVNTIYAKNETKAKTIHAIELIRGVGLKARLAEEKNGMPYLLIASKQQIFSKAYFEKDGSRFYLFKIDAHPRANFKNPIYFYNSPDDNKGRAFDMVMHKDPKVGKNGTQAELNWDFEGKKYTIHTDANKDLAMLMDMYPQVDYTIYMQSRSGMVLIKEIATKLATIMVDEKLSTDQAVNFVLRFTQKAFDYKTDFDAYGYERPVFVEQMVLLPYSDCEDRSTLLAHLYREIFGFESVGLQYAGHMSLGVLYDGKGDSVVHNGKKYFVADGSYFYAKAGVSQPSFKKVNPKVLATR